MEFIEGGREAIVHRFGEVTTKKAYEIWGDGHDSNIPVNDDGISI